MAARRSGRRSSGSVLRRALATVVVTVAALTPATPARAAALTSVDVEPASLVANVSGNVDVTFTPASSLPTGGKVEVTFPDDFTFGVVAASSPDGSIDGTFTVDSTGAPTILVTRGGTNSPVSGPLRLRLTNVRNPVVAGTTGTYAVRTLTSADVEIDADNAVAGDTITLTATTATTVTPASLVAGATGNATVAFTAAGNPVPGNGKVVITFPSGFVIGTPTATGNAAFLAGGTASVSVAGNVVTVTKSSGTASTTAANTVTLQGGITNPRVTGSTGTYSVVITNADDEEMAGSTSVTASTITAGALTGTPNVQPASLAPGVTGDVTVSFTTANPIPVSGQIEVTFPSGFTLGNGAATGATSLSFPGGVSVGTNGQVVTLTRTSGAEIAAATAVSFTLTNIRNPTVPGSTGTYSLATRTSAGVQIDAGTPAADTIATGALTGVNVEPASLQAGAVGNVVVSLTTSSAIASDGRVRVVFPSGYVLSSGASTTASSSTIDGSFAVSTIAAAAPTITLTRSGGTQVAPGTSVSLTLTNVKNPTSPGATGTYTVSTQTSAGTTVDTATASADTLTANVLTSTNVQPASLVAGSTGNVVVTFTLTNPLPTAGSRIVVTFPSGFSTTSAAFVSISGADGTLTVAGAGTSTLTLTRAGGATAFNSGTVVVTLSGIRVPTTVGSTGTYSIQTQTSGSVVIDQDTAVAADTVTAATLAGTDVEPASLEVGESGDVDVTFTPTNAIPADGTITITFPSGFELDSGGDTEATDTGLLSGIVTASTSGQTVTLTRSVGSSWSDEVELTLSNVRNPNTVGSGGTYTISTTTSGGVVIDRDALVAADTFVGVALSGTITSATESDVVDGGRTIVLTFGDGGATWAADVVSDATKRSALIAGIDWSDAVTDAIEDDAGSVVRTSASVVTITLPPVASYSISADDTVTVVVPASALSAGGARTAAPTVTITNETSTTTTTVSSGGGGGGRSGSGTTTTTTAPPSGGGGDDDGGSDGGGSLPPSPPAETEAISSGAGAFDVEDDVVVPLETPATAAAPVVGAAVDPDGSGHWTVHADGGVFTFGDAEFHGSAGDLPLVRPIVGMAPTLTGDGYWLVASDGGVFSFGDATFHGSTGDIVLNQPIVGLTPTPTGRGYWLVASDGGIFSFGDATFHGSTGAIVLNQPIVGLAARPQGDGYWMTARDGGVFAFGGAPFHGSAAGLPIPAPAVGIVPNRTGTGYVVVDGAGNAYRFDYAENLAPPAG